jgi:antitoxin component of MazEF toxin-antitoxin module
MEQFTNKIRRDGNSFVVTIPRKVIKNLEISINDKPIFFISKDGKK